MRGSAPRPCAPGLLVPGPGALRFRTHGMAPETTITRAAPATFCGCCGHVAYVTVAYSWRETLLHRCAKCAEGITVCLVVPPKADQIAVVQR